jgi:hypothetical protein
MANKSKRWVVAVAGTMWLAASVAPMARPQDRNRGIRHVLLISIDGMHALDFINCSKGISGVNGGEPYCPHLAELAETGINYLDTATSKPSDSFPGLMALMTGGSPRTVGAFYDVAYDRTLAPPLHTTGNGLAGGTCTPGVFPGTTTEYDEGIDINQNLLNGGAPTGDGGIASIDPTKLVRDPSKGCAPVYPWNFVRTNTIFGVVHAAGGYTAWSDKHPSYSAVSGPGNGTNVDDYYSPDINSIPVNLPGVPGCNPLPDQTAVSSSNAWTDSFQNIQCYDTLKVNAILNEINGKTHSGSASAPTPTLFGMNFQVVSIGQKLIEKSLSVTGGYQDAQGTPTAALLSEIQFTDASIGKMVAALKARGILDSTLIVISAKHGQSPVDSSRYTRITSSGLVTTSPATILDNAGCVPLSEAPSNPTGVGATEDDVSLVWLNSQCRSPIRWRCPRPRIDWWCHGVCNRACGARPGRAASEESADCGSGPESDSDSSHPRTAPAHDAAGSGTSRRYLAPCRPTADHWITETFRCDEDATQRPARCDSRWIGSGPSWLPTRDCSNALLPWELLPG